jgi:hypothetical protein
MRVLCSFIMMMGFLWTTVGCGYGPKPYYEGPKVPSFSGHVVQNGKPVSFPEDEEFVVQCRVIEGDAIGKAFGVPIKPDGSFSMGWMPLGKMSMRLERSWKDPAKTTGGPPRAYSVPGALVTESGKTSGYTIELGPGWKR